MDKIKRAQLTKAVNTRLWVKRAERKKREGEMGLIEKMQREGLGVADLLGGKGKNRRVRVEGEEDSD